MADEVNLSENDRIEALERVVPKTRELVDKMANSVEELKAGFGTTVRPITPISGVPVLGDQLATFSVIAGLVAISTLDEDSVDGKCGEELFKQRFGKGRYHIKIKNTGATCPVAATVNGIALPAANPGKIGGGDFTVAESADVVIACDSDGKKPPNACSVKYKITIR